MTRVSSVPDLRDLDVLTGVTRVACGDDAVKPHRLTTATVKAKGRGHTISLWGSVSERESCSTDLAKGSMASWTPANCRTDDGRLTLSTRGERDN